MIGLLVLLSMAFAAPDRCEEIRGHQRQLAAAGVLSPELDAMLATCTGTTPAVAVAKVATAPPARAHARSIRPVDASQAVPVAGVLTSRFGWRRFPLDPSKKQFHKGVDIGAPKGTPVRSAGAGVVVSAGRDEGHGKSVRVRHRDGVETSYSHLSAIVVRPGDRLQRGELLGRVGSTGVSTGPHLHFGVFVNGEAVDPLTHPLLAPTLEAR